MCVPLWWAKIWMLFYFLEVEALSFFCLYFGFVLTVVKSLCIGSYSKAWSWGSRAWRSGDLTHSRPGWHPRLLLRILNALAKQIQFSREDKEFSLPELKGHSFICFWLARTWASSHLVSPFWNKNSCLFSLLFTFYMGCNRGINLKF